MQQEILLHFTEKQREYLKKLQLTSLQEIVNYFPRAYLDLTKQTKLEECYLNEFVLLAVDLLQPAEIVTRGRQKLVKAHFVIYDERHHIQESFRCTWFNAAYVANYLKQANLSFLLYGRLQKDKYGNYAFVNPTIERAEENKHLKGLVPIYALRATVKQGNVRFLIQKALQLTKITSYIPVELQRQYKLLPLEKCYFMVHFPNTLQEKIVASERIAIEEYFILLSAFKRLKGDSKNSRILHYSCGQQELEAFIQRFPFTFTNAQRQAVAEILQDLHGQNRMNRLLQGDVGSGKTAVALCGIFVAVKSGYQAAMLAPTEVLAKQNFTLLQQYFPEYKVAYLAGSCSAKEKREIKKELLLGNVDIICGTHALLQEDVQFQNFAFCVCDEQHRFGVAQRNLLSEKGSATDMLIMSATPIPRTLSLILYGDLDCTTMYEKPKERLEVTTNIIPESKYMLMLSYLAEKMQNGEQCYFICPKIEEDEEGTLMSVTALFEELKLALPTARLALLHGKMKDSEKLAIMQAFKAKAFDALVSTTVVEVGVDVPNATHMVIYNAERFGLSQLHQLRGRVGRGNKKSYCFLLCKSRTEETMQRLLIFKQNADGFKIAEEDLALRGGGDFLGTKQSGKFFTELKNLNYSAKAIFVAKELVDLSANYAQDSAFIAFLEEKFKNIKEIILN